jgi:protein gp37
VKGHIPLELHVNRLDQPKHWTKPRRIFVNSLSDLFHDDVPDAFILRVLDSIRAGHAKGHVFQVLTKRPERMRSIMSRLCFDSDGSGRMYLEDRGLNRQGQPISFAPVMCQMWLGVSVENRRWKSRITVLRQTPAAVRFLSIEPLLEHIGDIDLHGIHWVIVGGESGPKHRPIAVEWVRDIRDQCVAAGVKFFFKQWGGPTPKSGGRLLDGRTWDEMPA